MHPTLEKRLRGVALAGAVAGSAVLYSGCATGHAGADAFGNFLGAVIVSEQGRSQQNVIVNQPSEQNMAEVIKNGVNNGWRFVACEKWVDYNHDGVVQEAELINHRKEFSNDETFNLFGVNVFPQFATRALSYALFDEKNNRVEELSLNGPGTGIRSQINPGDLKPGNYTAVWFYRNQTQGTVSFKVFASKTVSK